MDQPTFLPIGLNRPRLFGLLHEKNLDGILFTSPEAVFYTTGYPTLPSAGNPIVYALRNQLPFFSFAGKDETITLLAWMGAMMGIDYGVDDSRSFFTYQSHLEELQGFLPEKLALGCRIGVESTCPYYVIQVLHETVKPTEIIIIDDLLNRLRLVKSPAEIERIKKSTEIIEKTVHELAHHLHCGMTRLALIQEAKTRLMQNGAHGVDHITVAFGTANPEVALDEPIDDNQIVTIDLGAAYDGYVSDNRRLVYTGEAPQGLKELHGKLCWIVSEMGKAIRPGKTFAELHAYAFELYAQAGLDPFFLHVGHSVGMQVDEAWILGDDPTVIEEGMVLNIELYSGSEEGVMVGDEETYVVTANGVEQFTKLPVDIIQVKLFSEGESYGA